MKLKKVLFLLVVVFFLNFCSLQHTHPPKTMPEKVISEDDSKETLEYNSDSDVKGVDPALQSLPKPSKNRTVEPFNVIEQQVYQTGEASWYGPDFNGKRTANGEVYDMNKLTAAHPLLPFHTFIEVENIDNQKKVIVRINDRGPFLKGRIIDLSKTAASRLGLIETGTAPVNLRIYKPNEIPKYDNFPMSAPPVSQSTQSQPIQAQSPRSQSNESLTSQTGQFYIQLGAFSIRENAQEMINHLDDVMPDFSFSILKQNKLYKVLSKSMDTREEATQLLKQLKENGFDAFLMIRK